MFRCSVIDYSCLKIPEFPQLEMSVRPSMHTRDASGRQVSLLNDEPKQSQQHHYQQQQHPSFLRQQSYSSQRDDLDLQRANSYISNGSSPRTPDLLRADSYDSNMSNGPQSPLTPASLGDFGRQSSYTSAYPDPTQYDQRSIYGAYPEKRMPSLPMVRPAYERPNSYDESAYQAPAQLDRPTSGKRYPCRFKDSHGCDKTFTTSGHASRHSKIHTAEKAVHCSFTGCTKKFTRADNMKQHLETHYKERSRSSTSTSKTSTPSKLTIPAGVKKTPSGRTSRPASRTSQQPGMSPYDSSYQYPVEHYSPLASPATPNESLDMAQFRGALPTNPAPLHNRTSSDSYRLDALAAICSNGH